MTPEEPYDPTDDDGINQAMEDLRAERQPHPGEQNYDDPGEA
jgi:hypothetical protein